MKKIVVLYNMEEEVNKKRIPREKELGKIKIYNGKHNK